MGQVFQAEAVAEGHLVQAQTSSLNPKILNTQLSRLETQLAQAHLQLAAVQAEVENAQAFQKEIQSQISYLKIASPIRAKYLHLMGLEKYQDRLAENLSGGMKRKLALCCVLVSQPQILLLDEPTTEVDPVSMRELWDDLAAIA